MNDRSDSASPPAPDARQTEPDRNAGEPGVDALAADASPVFVLAVVGDSGSGKSTVADAVTALLGPEHVTDVQLDDYHRFTREERRERGVTSLNPMVHNLALMQEHLSLLRSRRPARSRIYDHADGTFGSIRVIEPNDIVLVRGLLGFPTAELRSLYDLAVFLQPEPELLFRWKLRRDVLFRGYREEDVLKYIASHLLDSKEFVLPQAARAHVYVHFALPELDAPDSEVRTIVRLRQEVAQLARERPPLAGLPVDVSEEGGELVLTIPADISLAEVDRWGREHFPERYMPERAGIYADGEGEVRRRGSLAVVELLIAQLARDLREG